MVSIGAHVYGGSINSASVIGKYGNPYGDYIAAFGLPLPNDALNLIPVTGNRSISAPVPAGYGSSIPISMATTVPIRPASQTQNSERPVVPQTQPRSHRERRPTLTKLVQNGGFANGPNRTARSQQAVADEERFMKVLKTAESALPTGMGIAGGPIGALAGFALNASSNVIAQSTTAESVMDGPALYEGSMERAILAEATLSALQSAELPPGLEESIFSDIKDTVLKALPVIRKAAPHVMGAMMEPALKIALDSLHNYNKKAASGAESFEANTSEPFRPTVLYSSAIDNRADHQTEAFLDHLHTSLLQNLQESAMDGDSEEGFFDLIAAGARLAGKGVLAAVKHGLPIIVDVMKQSGGAESFEDQPSSGPAPRLLAADPLAQRALVADAALKAVMSVPPQQLEEEGFFSSIGDAIKKIAPIAMKIAPVVAGAIHPAVGMIVKGVLKQESTYTDDSTISGNKPSRRTGIKDLSTKRSLHTLRGGNNRGDDKCSHCGQPAADMSRNGAYNRVARRLEY